MAAPSAATSSRPRAFTRADEAWRATRAGELDAAVFGIFDMFDGALARATGKAAVMDIHHWWRFRDGLICEVRAYYHGGVPDNLSGDLVGFDHGGRGHTVLDATAERSTT